MEEKIRHTGSELKGRWVAKMPRFFRRIVIVCACIVGTAIGVNTMLTVANATPHQWWNDIYPYLVGVPTGMAIVCKLTVAGGYKDIDPDKLIRHNLVLDSDDNKNHHPHDGHEDICKP